MSSDNKMNNKKLVNFVTSLTLSPDELINYIISISNLSDKQSKHMLFILKIIKALVLTEA